MAFGILEGNKLDITTEKTSFVPGESIRGKLMLTLGAPKKANGLRIMFYGEYTKRSGKSSRTVRIFEQTIRLGEAKEYPAGTAIYDFELPIPMFKRSDSPGIKIGPFTLGGAIDPVAMSKWYLDASLDVGMELDVNKKMKISMLI